MSLWKGTFQFVWKSNSPPSWMFHVTFQKMLQNVICASWISLLWFCINIAPLIPPLWPTQHSSIINIQFWTQSCPTVQSSQAQQFTTTPLHSKCILKNFSILKISCLDIYVVLWFPAEQLQNHSKVCVNFLTM